MQATVQNHSIASNMNIAQYSYCIGRGKKYLTQLNEAALIMGTLPIGIGDISAEL